MHVVATGIAAVLMATAVSSSVQAAPATSPNIQAVMKAAHTSAAVKQADKFAAAPAMPVVAGAPFTVVFQPRDGDSTGVSPSSGFWTYKEGFLQFHLSLDSAPGPITYGGPDKPKVIFFAGRMTPGAPYVGTNAYRASVQVRVEKWSRDAVAVVSAPEGEVSPFHAESQARYAKMGISMPAMPKDTYPFGVAVAGPAAKSLVTNVRVVVEGTFAPAPGKPGLTDCYQSYFGPKIDAPYDITEDACWVGANIARIAYVNAVTGEVLKAWGTPP